MPDPIRVMLEIGPKAKKVVAVAPDWPGLERGAKTEELALERLAAYRFRYDPIVALAGLDALFAISGTLDVVERYLGVGSTDFWGISFAISELDREPLSPAELDRQLTLVRACWTFFDQVRARVSPELQKGTRGGGRDRDHIVHHTVATEQDWAKKLQLPGYQNRMPTEDELTAHRDAYLTAIRAFHAEDKPARTWPLRYLIRHTAYHTLDHAWEMEDKDLTEQ